MISVSPPPAAKPTLLRYYRTSFGLTPPALRERGCARGEAQDETSGRRRESGLRFRLSDAVRFIYIYMYIYIYICACMYVYIYIYIYI